MLEINYPDPSERAKRIAENAAEDAALVEARHLLGPYAIVEGDGCKIGVLYASPPRGTDGSRSWLATGDSWEMAFAHIRRLLAAGMVVSDGTHERAGITYDGAEVTMPQSTDGGSSHDD